MEAYRLPDGREPIRFDSSNAAFYARKHGPGEIRYTFSKVRYKQQHQQLVPPAELSRRRKERAAALLKVDPDYYRNLKIKSQESKNAKKDREHERNTKSQGHAS